MSLSALLPRPLPVVRWRCWLPPRGARTRDAGLTGQESDESKSGGSTTRSAANLGAMDVEVRTITADDWPLLRDVSLRALADSPDAFRRTLAEAQALTEDFWRRRAGGSAPILVVLEDGRGVAMGGVFTPPDSAVADVGACGRRPRHAAVGTPPGSSPIWWAGAATAISVCVCMSPRATGPRAGSIRPTASSRPMCGSRSGKDRRCRSRSCSSWSDLPLRSVGVRLRHLADREVCLG